MSTVPPKPSEGSRKPVFPRSSALMVSFTSWGVSAASCASTGPSLPLIFIVPPPGSPIEKTSGTWFFVETSRAVRFTGAYTLRFCEFVLPMVIWPSFSSSFPIDKDSAALLLDPLGSAFCGSAGFGSACLGSAGALPPMDEKFHLPLGSFSSITCGFSMTIWVTFTCLEKIKGSSSTPTLTELAVRNGPELNFGSSLIERLSIPTEARIIDKLRFRSEKDQGQQLHADSYRARRQEWSRIELRIVADREVVNPH